MQTENTVEGSKSLPPAGGMGGLAPSRSIVESVLLGLLALVLMGVPTVTGLMRLAGAWQEDRHAHWVRWLGRGLGHILPKDLSWGLSAAQHTTVWIGLLGAVIAVGAGKHLGLSTLHLIRNKRLRQWATGYSTSVFLIITLCLVYGSARMVVSNVPDAPTSSGWWLPWADVKAFFHKMYYETNESNLPVPQWILDLIMPAAFSLMALRMALRVSAAPPGTTPSVSRSVGRWLFRLFLVALVFAALYLGLMGAEVYLDRIHWMQKVANQAPRTVTLLAWIIQHGAILRWIGIGFVVVAFFLGLPIFLAIAGSALILFATAGDPVGSAPNELARLLKNPSLPAIPLLTLLGYLLTTSRSAERLVRLYKSMFGWLPGGLAIMAVAICALFTALTGASGVTILALGGLIVPSLRKEGYSNSFSLGVVTAAGSLGLLFPPSLPVFLYSIAASAPGSKAPVSAGQLFVGGLLPSLLMIVLVMVYGMATGVRSKVPRTPFRLSEFLSAAWAAKWDLLLPLVIVVPFSMGWATISEAAAFGAVYTLLMGLLIKRDIHPVRDVPAVLVQAGTLIGAVVLVLGMALALTNYLVTAEVPGTIFDFVSKYIHSKWLFLLVLNVILLVLGSVLEIYSAIVVLVPIIAPLAIAYNIHPVHLGVVFLCNMELGFLLPPIGLNLLLASNRFRTPLTQMYKNTWPFLLIMTLGVVVITYFEPATTWLLHFFSSLSS